ncbi:MAG TPA: hypothetical protein VEY05_05105 [Beijerinckiaceae bacterium]|nr:hypothetical protein [Beijerinckiaceae bacterium]
MSEPLTDIPPATPAEAAKPDPAATAALEPAVTSAEASSAEASSAGTTDATQPAATAAKPLTGLGKVRALAARADRKHAAAAIAAALALALGWAGGSQALSGARPMPQTLPGWAEATAGIRQNQEDMVRLAGDVTALKGVLAAFKDSFENAKVDAAQNRPLLERLDKLERASRDARRADAADHTERAATAPDAKFAALDSRLDAIERPAVEPSRTGSLPEPKLAAKPKSIEGWVLREVYDGGAVVESRNGRLYEVTPGRSLPSVGRVETIERRGKSWVVVTAKGVIGPPARWR